MGLIAAIVQAGLNTAGGILAYYATESKKDNLKEQRMVEKRRTRIEQEQRARRERALIGTSIALGAASGFQVGTGTSLTLMEEAASASRREGRRIDYAGELALRNIDVAIDDLRNAQVIQIFGAATGVASAVGNAIVQGRGETPSETRDLAARRFVASDSGRNLVSGVNVAARSPSFATSARGASVSLLGGGGSGVGIGSGGKN